ncbi:hypothetical protein NDI76_07540 [Halogeometricum sp. S1BR25-6]|uniref:Uncharacterized protein n=1 Tax=Halogeometricum salsisoli TaxID=2950536 RepID=A0ABU2GCP8_9EURY|nr:hypothetical protein [Halogeometricum sp. S1BR25-6]MDS0298591.1 hypothetical protein [Halogeometricum sp. S1BR25-6]
MNDLAEDGWELDEAVVNWWGGAELFSDALVRQPPPVPDDDESEPPR